MKILFFWPKFSIFRACGPISTAVFIRILSECSNVFIRILWAVNFLPPKSKKKAWNPECPVYRMDIHFSPPSYISSTSASEFNLLTSLGRLLQRQVLEQVLKMTQCGEWCGENSFIQYWCTLYNCFLFEKENMFRDSQRNSYKTSTLWSTIISVQVQLFTFWNECSQATLKNI